MNPNPNNEPSPEDLDLYDRLFTDCLIDAFQDAMKEQHVQCRLGNVWK